MRFIRAYCTVALRDSASCFVLKILLAATEPASTMGVWPEMSDA
jgi:hypothetical protein